MKTNGDDNTNQYYPPPTSLIWNDNFLWNDTCREQGTTPYFSSATTHAHKVMKKKKHTTAAAMATTMSVQQ